MLWKKKGCPSCGTKLEKDWDFCPRCGSMAGAPAFGMGEFDSFDRFFSQIQKNMENMFREAPTIRVDPNATGISVTITGRPGGAPRVSVKKSGGQKQVQNQVEQKGLVGEQEKFTNTVEPEMKIERERGGGWITYTILLPGVKGINDIKITRLQNSVEVRARAGDTLYFKIFEAPRRLEIIEKKFENSRLSLMMGAS